MDYPTAYVTLSELFFCVVIVRLHAKCSVCKPEFPNGTSWALIDLNGNKVSRSRGKGGILATASTQPLTRWRVLVGGQRNKTVVG